MNKPLHIAYRPSTLEDFIGQPAAVKSVLGLLDSKAMPHAFLIHGPSGTGKTTLARILANELKCAIQEVDAAVCTSVQDVRDLLTTIHYKELGVRTNKMIIYDETHRVSKQGFDAMLKSLEEPPAHVYWALCTTDPGKLPKTIHTRCQNIELKPILSSELHDLLDYVNQEELLNLPEDILSLCAEKASGGARQALVNLSMCQSCATRKEAAQILNTADLSDDADPTIMLCRTLIGGRPTWKRVLTHVKEIEADPESIRLIVLAYVSKVLTNTTNEANAATLLAILDAFQGPWNTSERKAPLLLALGSLIL